jgi:hypothetical protein
MTNKIARLWRVNFAKDYAATRRRRAGEANLRFEISETNPAIVHLRRIKMMAGLTNFLRPRLKRRGLNTKHGGINPAPKRCEAYFVKREADRII